MTLQWRKLQRLWRPRSGLFWLFLVFNALSAFLAWYVHLNQPPEPLRVVLVLLALINTGMGWLMLLFLWREGAQADADR
ncbi:hypothetical protein [Hydrogenophaga sp.]|uniref:hypothetical protein n=1 Tax=Hydrogenophaga sp. TaxID=1904254 RepID=UPI0019BE1145|nr:hypothetical protein [Hydrogenophaga sp.]MBD3892530.1 hypothetical protein [Hydrogenophaga sp.]